jgi:hypothetical protein
MIVPFIALIAVIVLIAMFIGKNAKNKDKGNRPQSNTNV